MRIEYIKFKAKRLDNGEWVEGSLTYSQGIAYIHRKESDEDDRCYLTPYKVIPETVCQFTGMMDEDCNEIWEGDIVEREIWNKLYNGLTKVKGVIEYKGAEFFVAINSETYSLYSKDIKVVGNKFDKEK